MAFIIDGTTGIATVDGSVSAPSQRGQDSNSGISYAADTIKFSTNGVERLSITNSGLSGDGSGLSGIAAGITMADMWRVSASSTGSKAPITANWERCDTNYAKIGTGMSESSGVFTFPSTGIYYLIHKCAWSFNGSDSFLSSRMDVSTDSGSNYSMQSYAYNYLNNYADTQYITCMGDFMLDVTNTSTTSVRMHALTGNSNVTLTGDSGANFTTITFLRLGDT